MSVEARLRASFARQGMLGTFAAEMVEVGDGHVRIDAPIGPAVSQQHGYAHAALAFGLGDSACGYAALTLLPPTREVVTSEMKINLLRPAMGTRMIARGRVLKPGRVLIVVEASVHVLRDGAEVQVAALLGTMVPVDP